MGFRILQSGSSYWRLILTKMNYGISIKEIRKQVGLSQQQLSKRSKISQTSVSQIENGYKHPSKKTLQKICKGLGVPELVIYIKAIEYSDVPESRKQVFNKIFPKIRDLVDKMITES